MNQEKNQSPDQRQHLRRTSYIIVEYRVKEGVFRDIMKNIGAQGIFISTSRKIAEGQPIILNFPLFAFEHQIQASGRVVRVGPHGFSVEFDQPIEGLICKEGQFPVIVHEIDRDPAKE